MKPNSPLPEPENHAKLQAVDRALAEFFHSQLPSPWPECPEPTTRSSRTFATASDQPRNSGRFALAASVALLLGLGLALAPAIIPNPKPAAADKFTSGATANGKDLLKGLDSDRTEPKAP